MCIDLSSFTTLWKTDLSIFAIYQYDAHATVQVVEPWKMILVKFGDALHAFDLRGLHLWNKPHRAILSAPLFVSTKVAYIVTVCTSNATLSV